MTVLFAYPDITEPQVPFKPSRNEGAGELLLFQVGTRRSRFVAKAKARRTPREESPAGWKMDAAVSGGTKSKDRMNVEPQNQGSITDYSPLGSGGRPTVSS